MGPSCASSSNSVVTAGATNGALVYVCMDCPFVRPNAIDERGAPELYNTSVAPVRGCIGAVDTIIWYVTPDRSVAFAVAVAYCGSSKMLGPT